MEPTEESILAVAKIDRDLAAVNDAALAGDLDEARFQVPLIVAKADADGNLDLVLAATHLVHILGPEGTTPHPGYGAGMLRVANELQRIGFQPL